MRKQSQKNVEVAVHCDAAVRKACLASSPEFGLRKMAVAVAGSPTSFFISTDTMSPKMPVLVFGAPKKEKCARGERTAGERRRHRSYQVATARHAGSAQWLLGRLGTREQCQSVGQLLSTHTAADSLRWCHQVSGHLYEGSEHGRDAVSIPAFDDDRTAARKEPEPSVREVRDADAMRCHVAARSRVPECPGLRFTVHVRLNLTPPTRLNHTRPGSARRGSNEFGRPRMSQREEGESESQGGERTATSCCPQQVYKPRERKLAVNRGWLGVGVRSVSFCRAALIFCSSRAN